MWGRSPHAPEPSPYRKKRSLPSSFRSFRNCLKGFRFRFLWIPTSRVSRRRVLEAGASIINDITGLRYPEMAPIIAEYDAGVVIMHMQGSPENMQEDVHYDDCVGEIKQFLEQGIQTAVKAGIASDRIWVDPGIGFGKTVKHNLEILAHLDAFASLQKPLLLGTSRKSFIGKILDLPVAERLEGSLATAVIGMIKGARILRVHDVQETYRAVRIVSEILKVQNGK